MDTTEILSKLKEPLKIEDVDFRIQSISNNGYACIISYKDARVDMNRLDAICGVNWQDDYKILNNELYCGIAIKVNDEWIWRWDVGIESNTEKVKGRASDAFKRAAYRWGIGRELYNHPRIYVQLKPEEYTTDGSKGRQSNKLKLDKWKWDVSYDDGGNVLHLTAHDQYGNLRYSFPDRQPQQQSQQPAPVQQPVQPSGEKPMLNKMNGKGMSKQWQKIVQRILHKNSEHGPHITSIDVIKNHFKLSQENETELTNLIKSANNGSN